MKSFRTSLAALALLLCFTQVWASTIVYRFKGVDDTGALVTGAVVVLNTAKSFNSGSLGTTDAFTVTSAGTAPYTTTGVAPTWNLTANNVNVQVLDLGNGDYGIPYDPEGAYGEILINLTFSKAGSTITNQNASISLALTKDSSRVLNADSSVAGVQTTATSTNTRVTTALPTIAPTSPGGLITSGTGSYQINPNGTTGALPDSPGTTTLVNALTTWSSTVNDGLSTTTVIDTALTGTSDLTGSKVVFTTGTLKGVARTISSMNTSTGQITLLTALPSAPVNGVAFTAVQGSKAQEQFLAALGSDNRPYITSQQTNVLTAADVTAVWAATARTLTAFSFTPTIAAITGITLPSVVPSSAQIAAAILATPANLLATDGTGKVGANNLPSDYQQRSVAVTLPTTAPSGYGGATAAAVAGLILATPGTPIANDSSGKVALQAGEHTAIAGDVLNATASSYNTALTIGAKINSGGSASDPLANPLTTYNTAGTVGYQIRNNLANAVPTFPTNFSALSITSSTGLVSVGSIASGVAAPAGFLSSSDQTAIANTVLGSAIDGTLTVKQVWALTEAFMHGRYTTSDTSSAPYVRTVTYYRADGVSILAVQPTTYTDATFSKVLGTTGRAAPTFSNLP